MRSIVLVSLQFALIAGLLWPTGGAQWGLVSLALVGAGALLGVWALAANPPGNFNIRPEPRPQGRLIDHGPYRFVRHPMYLALLLAGIGVVVHDPSPLHVMLLVALAIVLDVKARIEEAALAKLHPGYAEYRARTARWIPLPW